jgi:predicted nucleotidyltransferase component of viral defense system
MREEALALARSVEDPAARLNLLREYVQAFALRSLHESEAFSSVAFIGGTALRFLESLPRFSENLDFSLYDERGYAPGAWLAKLGRDLALAGFDSSIRFSEKKAVNTAWIRTAALLEAAGLATRPEQRLSIKLEIDTRPPAGAELARAVITRHLTFALSHYRIGSLMAGKIHALITRPYGKGRDWYDLLWYRSRRPPVEPNLVLLQNALDQTRKRGAYDAADWRRHVREKLGKERIENLARDVTAFLERPADRTLMTREHLEAALEM